MNQSSQSPPPEAAPQGIPAVRAVVGGVLMGLANLVPGISGGTMLLAAGVYNHFIEAIAEVTSLRFTLRSILTLGLVAGCAVLAIILLAGPVKDLVVNQRWIMLSLFIGLTLGGVPIVWRMLGRPAPAAYMGAVFGFLMMAALAVVQQRQMTGGGDPGTNFFMLVLAGAAGASAMILPGVSGGYLLLVLGQYVPILASISRLKDAVSAREFGAAFEEWKVVVPVGVGVVVGVVVVSHALRWCLKKHEKATLGVLLGLLVGAVVGLWPFQRAQAPEVGDELKGQTVVEVIEREDGTVTARTALDEIEAEDFPVAFFTPGATQVFGSIGLIAVGFGLTMGVARIGAGKPEREQK